MPLHHELSPLQSLCELHRTLQWTGAKGRRSGRALQVAKRRWGIPLKMTTLPNAGGGCAHACTHGAALSFAGSLGVSIGNGLAGGLDTYLGLAMWSLGKPRSRERGGVP